VPMFYSDFYFHSVLGFLFSSGIYIFVTWKQYIMVAFFTDFLMYTLK
jgi:hypothetical protein